MSLSYNNPKITKLIAVKPHKGINGLTPYEVLESYY